MKKILIFLCVLLTLVGCTNSKPNDEIKPPDEPKILIKHILFMS